LIGFSVAVYTETPFMLFVMAGCYFALLALERLRSLDAALAGLFWGLAYLTRPEGIAYLLLTIVAIAIVTWIERRPPIVALRASVIAAGIALVIAAPYVFYLWQQTGSLRLEGKNLVNYTIIKRMEAGMSYNEAA